ncbi:MAG: hypothetical protein NVSMB24_39160 [Mucilaginibacter sp.]
MDKHTVLRKLDDLLKEFYDFKEHNKNGIITMLRVGRRLPFHSMDEMNMLISKLERDGYLICKKENIYTITAEGFLFGGYVKKEIIDAQNERRIIRNEKLLIRGTWFAGLAAILLLVWQIFLYYYPPHAEVVRVILQKRAA